MPRLNDLNLEKKNFQGRNFGYSAARIDQLGACEYTLVTIVQDVSGSVNSYKKEMEECLAEIVRSCIKSPRADNLMIRFLQFGNNVKESHGFKLLEHCNPDDYRGILKINGATALFDAAENALLATAEYGRQLVKHDFDANGIIFIITDGDDNNSTATVASVKEALASTWQGETLESLVTILIGVGTGGYPRVRNLLKEFRDKAGLDEFVELKDAKAATLAKLAEFISKSISAQSCALGSGGASAPAGLTF